MKKIFQSPVIILAFITVVFMGAIYYATKTTGWLQFGCTVLSMIAGVILAGSLALWQVMAKLTFPVQPFDQQRPEVKK